MSLYQKIPKNQVQQIHKMIEIAKITFYNDKKSVNNFKKLPEDQKWHKNFSFKIARKCQLVQKKNVESATRCPTKTKNFKKLVKS